MEEPDDYDVFLDSWKPSETLNHATLQQNLSDPFSFQRVSDDSTASASLSRTPNAIGQKKEMTTKELRVRGFDFFVDKQNEWAKHFYDYVLSKGVSESKIDTYCDSIRRLWVDGRSKRQNSSEMLAIKASIRDFDQKNFPSLTCS